MNITSFNIKNILPKYKGCRIKDIYNLIKNDDIICFQELTPISNILLRWYMRKEYKFYTCIFGTGIAVKKEYKIVDKYKIKLFDNYKDVLRDFDKYRKATSVKLDNGLNIYSCHFGFNNEWYVNYYNLLADLNKSNLFICGDFNISQNDPEYPLLLEISKDLTDLNKNHVPTIHGFNPDQTKWKVCDYILTNIKCNHTQFHTYYNQMSDHFKITANVSY